MNLAKTQALRRLGDAWMGGDATGFGPALRGQDVRKVLNGL
jgi:hypothetical protein